MDQHVVLGTVDQRKRGWQFPVETANLVKVGDGCGKTKERGGVFNAIFVGLFGFWEKGWLNFGDDLRSNGWCTRS